MTTSTEVMKRVAKFYICDGCGEREWKEHEFIMEVTVRAIGEHTRKYMHFCAKCFPTGLTPFMDNAEEDNPERK